MHSCYSCPKTVGRLLPYFLTHSGQITYREQCTYSTRYVHALSYVKVMAVNDVRTTCIANRRSNVLHDVICDILLD